MEQVYGVWAVRSAASMFGHAEAWCKEDGRPLEFESLEAAQAYALELNRKATANVRYFVKEKEPEPNAVRVPASQPDIEAVGPVDRAPRNDVAEKHNEIPGRQMVPEADPVVEIRSAVHSNYANRAGRIYGLLGRNGAGKTTIMKMILGLAPITSGEVDVFGQNIKGREKQIYPRIGAIIENPGFYPNLTGTENLKIFAEMRGIYHPNAVKSALEVVGLPYRDKKLFSKYSLGMKQRLGIANAILHDPELLILDEPTNGLDPIGIAEVRNFIKDLSVERGKTILISSHILSEISLLADDIGIIDHGVLLEESSMEELEKKNRKYILLQVSDASKASLLLEHEFHVKDYAMQDEHTLRLYDTALDVAAINKFLVMQDVAVIGSQLCHDTLEDYFKEITGGVGIA